MILCDNFYDIFPLEITRDKKQYDQKLSEIISRKLQEIISGVL